jgi:prepilin-type N-terminal cleavage/methylation domain-containing protein
MKQNQKGFSLIELVVAIAILSIVGLGVVAFLSTSTQSYASVSQNVDVQEEAQTAVNQIVSLMQNAEMGITGTDRSGDGSLLIYNEDYRYVIVQSGDKLYYLKQNKKASDDNTSYVFDAVDVSAVETGGFSLLAENVSSFSATDVTTSDSSNSVMLLSVEFEKGSGSTAEYSVSQNVVLRNTVTLNATSYKDVYGTPESPVQRTTYSNLTVTIDNPAGTDTEFSYTPASSGAVYVAIKSDTDNWILNYSVSVSYTGPNPDPSYTAVLSGADDPTKTYVDTVSQEVYIDAGQTGDLELNVSLVKNTSVQVKIPIRIVRLTAVSIREGSEVKSGFGSLCYCGNSVWLGRESGLVAEAAGTNLIQSDWSSVTWKVEILDSQGNMASGYPQEVSGGLFTIPAEYRDYKIRFTAVSAFQPLVSAASDTYTILAEHDKITLALVQSTMNRGQTALFDLTDETGASYARVSGYSTADLEFSINVENAATHEALSDTSGIRISKVDSKITISASNDKLDYNCAYTVSMMVRDTKRDIESNWVTFTIPAVTVKFTPSVVQLFSRENRWYSDYYYKQVDYEVVSGIELGSINNAEVGLLGKTSSNGLYETVNSFDSSTGTGKFAFYRQYTGNNLNRTGYVEINGTAIDSGTLNIYGTTIPTHTLRIVADKTEVDRGGSVTVHVYKKNLTSGEETELSATELAALNWSYAVGDNPKSDNLRSGNVITIWSSNQILPYYASNTVTITVQDDTETASVAVTVPKVTVEYSENPVYLCIPDNKVSDRAYPYQKTVTYTIKGISNAKIVKFGISNYNIGFDYADGSFVVKCKTDSDFSQTINAYIQVNGIGTPVELSGSAFTISGKPANSITHDGTVYTIKPESTGKWIQYGDIQYWVNVQRWGYGWESATCWIYCDTHGMTTYEYDYETQSWVSGY